MKRENKIALTIASCMIAFGVFLVIWMLPFIYMYIGVIEQGKTHTKNLKWDKLAVKYSIFKGQKVHSIPSAILSFILTKDYDAVIEYSKELERLGELSGPDKYFMSKAYFEKGDYENALKYANNKEQELRIYIRMNDLEKANELVAELLKAEPVKPNTYLYKSEVELAAGNWKEAEIWVNKLLQINPQHLEALKVKAKILKHLGRNNEYELYRQKIKELEDKYQNMVLTK